MKRSQFINSLAKKAGVKESEARLFAEIFLRKVYELIQPGDGILLDGIGTANFARTRFDQDIPSDNRDDLAEVIIFNEVQLDGSSDRKPVIFTIPAPEEIKHNPLDKYFNLSPSKPVLQNFYSQSEVLLIPPTGNELEALLFSKVDKLLRDYKVTNNYVDPGLIINISENVKVETKISFDDKLLDEELDSLLLADINDEELLKELESIVWDMDEAPLSDVSGDNLLTEFDEELKVSDEDSPLPEKEFSRSAGSLEEPEQIDPAQVPQESHQNSIDETNIQSESIVDNEMEEGPLTETTEFERVKSFSSEFLRENPNAEKQENEDAFQAAIDKVTRELESDDYTADNIHNKLDSSGGNDSGFIEVIPKSSVYNPNIINVVEAENQDEQEVQEDESKIDPEEYHREALKEASEFVKDRRSRDISKEKKRSNISLLIIILILILLSASIYLYFKFIKAPETSLQSGNGGGNIANTSLVEVIERNFELPVTYPYPENRRDQFVYYSGIDSSVMDVISGLNKSDSEIAVIPSSGGGNNVTTALVDPSGKAEVVRIKNNVYRYGEYFVVQVASFKSRTIAESEASKYNRQGHQSYIEEVDIPGRGVWYRLRVGNFQSVADADNFESKSK